MVGMPPWKEATLLLSFVISLISANDFGGDFSSSGAPGSAPGPSAGTMGDKAAGAMAIGTGASGPGNYGGTAESYKTPNYTQYTNQDFKGLQLLIQLFATPSKFCIYARNLEKPSDRSPFMSDWTKVRTFSFFYTYIYIYFYSGKNIKRPA